MLKKILKEKIKINFKIDHNEIKEYIESLGENTLVDEKNINEFIKFNEYIAISILSKRINTYILNKQINVKR